MQESQASTTAFKLKTHLTHPLTRKVIPLFAYPLERMLAFHRANKIFKRIVNQPPTLAFADQVLTELSVTYQVSDADLTRIPKTGPVLLVANHPFGLIDGLILISLLQSIRPDFKILSDYVLGHITQVRDFLILTHPKSAPDAANTNYRALKSSIQWLKNGGMLVVFPGVDVSHLQVSRRQITDPEWNEIFARLIRLTQVPVTPVFFKGSNTILFQIMGYLHRNLRNLMLPQQMLKKQAQAIQVRIGQPIPFKKLNTLASNSSIMEFLRLRTYILQNNHTTDKRNLRKKTLILQMENDFEPIIPALDPQHLAQEIRQLPAQNLLVRSGDYEVWFGKAAQIPAILKEIGRLREITFRAVGEGTGKPIDLDDFDHTYYHLFIWNKEKSEIVGAYRIGASEEILPQFGVAGFYTSTLFHYKPQLLQQMRPALEMGRSFIRIEYQKVYSSLLLLWRGISHFVLQYPQYKILFGPVSISNSYHPTSQQLMLSYLRTHNFLTKMSRQVKPKTPPRRQRVKGWNPKSMQRVVQDIHEVSDLVSSIESDCKGVPILIKQYLKMGGKLLGFNVDPDFGDVVDGLILVDLTQTDPSILERYMGQEGLAKFLAYHQMQPAC
ncbi:lysophospholipid acyltransferase family protein [candidate division KSB1 bacterium]|nr:lysophospholipid acyltransferase family protein [candidate division KSB1 bacterium]